MTLRSLALARAHRVGLAAILLVALAMRFVLVYRGGQGYWPDEVRYTWTQEALAEVLAGRWHAGLVRVLGSADHPGFKLLALLPALVQRELHLGVRWAAAFVSLFSSANIALVWGIARRAEAGEREALGAAGVMACSNLMFYWCRHLVPYDVSLFWALATMYAALGRGRPWHHSIAVGALGALSFLTYSGYWTLVALAIGTHVVLAPSVQVGVRRAICTGAALAGSLALAWGGSKILGTDLLESARAFSSAVNQGDFGDGGHVLVAVLWSAEGPIAIVWACTVLVLLARAAGGATLERRASLWLISLAAIAGSLVMGADVVRKFVVYGRLVRQLAPFFALVTGYVLFGDRARERRRWVPAAGAVGLGFAAAWNFAGPLVQQFPVEFIERGRAATEDYLKTVQDPTMAASIAHRFRFVNAGFIWPEPVKETLPAHREILAAPHPVQYPPYLYEGYNREQRDAINRADVRMQLILVDEGASPAAHAR